MDLVLSEMVYNQNNQPMTDSRAVAKYFEKEHKHVLRDIEEMKCSPEFRESNFGPSSYINSQNKEQPQYLISRNGFVFLAMGYTGERAATIKEKYIEAFDRMEKMISGQYIRSSNPDVEASVSLRSYLDMAQMLGAPIPLSRAMAVQHIHRSYGLDLKPLLTENVSAVQDKLCTPSELAAELGTNSKDINKRLEYFNLQKKAGKGWELTEKGRNFGVYLDVGKKHSSGTPVQQIKWYKDKVLPEITNMEEKFKQTSII